MAYYRLYFINRMDGRIESFAELEAPDHAHAIDLASEHEGMQPLELWCGRIMVHRFEVLTASQTG